MHAKSSLKLSHLSPACCLEVQLMVLTGSAPTLRYAAKSLRKLPLMRFNIRAMTEVALKFKNCKCDSRRYHSLRCAEYLQISHFRTDRRFGTPTGPEPNQRYPVNALRAATPNVGLRCRFRATLRKNLLCILRKKSARK